MSAVSEKVIGLSYYNESYEGEEKDKQERRKTCKEEKADANGLATWLNTNQTDKKDIKSIVIRNREDAWNTSKEDGKGNEIQDEDDIPDGGWGWIVAAGGFIGQMLINMLVACFGILYSKFLLDLGTSAVVSSWVFNLMGFMMTLSGLFVRALVVEFGFRNTTYIGTLLCFVGTTATAFATSPWYLMFFYSFIAGLGNGIQAPLIYSIVPYYFKRRLGFANAIMSAGVSAGQIVGPPLITLLQHQYAFQGATLILGALILNCSIGATVFHPVEWHKKKPKSLPKKASDSPRGLDLAVRIVKNTLGNLKLLKSPKAVIIALGGTLNVIGYLNFLMLVPFAMQEAGFTVEDAASCVAVSGITNLVTRLFVSVMADFSWFNMRYCYMIGTLIVVVLTIAFSFLTDLTTMSIVMGLWGCGVGAYMGLFNLVMVKYMGVEKLMAQLGLTSFVSSIWFLSSGPIFGLIRDATGSYIVSLITLAGTISITFILYLFLPAAIAYEQRKEEREKKEKDNHP